jgi:NAD(P)-dependent dehydrogenase (short-subunit alcohol dehydrogenase family)
MEDLKNKKILVTGGGGVGVGGGICQALEQFGATIVLNEISIEKAETACERYKHAIPVAADIGDGKQVEAMFETIAREVGKLDGLVNNAGVNDGVGLEKGNYESFVASLHKNLIHYYLMAHHVLPELIKSKGSIVNIGSKVAATGQGNTSAYAASNGGRNALTREWAVELLKYGIRVNAVLVAECYTPLYDKWIKTLPDSEEALKKINDKIPLGKRMTTDKEIADMVVFLLSERSSHTTGQLIYVDGGYTHLDRALL